MSTKLGYEPDQMHIWNLSRLRELLSWMGRGVSFTGDRWTANNLGMAVSALQLVADNIFNQSVQALMGTLGGPFAISKHTVANDPEIHADATINLWIPDQHADVIKAMAYLAHEIGHRVDSNNNIASRYGDWWAATGAKYREVWTDDGSGKLTLTSSTVVPTAPLAVSQYAETDVGEDFAETFAYFAIGRSYPGFGDPSPGRASAFWSYLPR